MPKAVFDMGVQLSRRQQRGIGGIGQGCHTHMGVAFWPCLRNLGVGALGGWPYTTLLCNPLRIQCIQDEYAGEEQVTQDANNMG